MLLQPGGQGLGGPWGRGGAQPQQTWVDSPMPAHRLCEWHTPFPSLSVHRLIWKIGTVTSAQGRSWYPGQENLTHLWQLPAPTTT